MRRSGRWLRNSRIAGGRILAATRGVVPTDIDCLEPFAVRPMRDIAASSSCKVSRVTASRAIKQTESEVAFQLSDQHAQSGRSIEERFRRAREAAVLRNQLKGS